MRRGRESDGGRSGLLGASSSIFTCKRPETHDRTPAEWSDSSVRCRLWRPGSLYLGLALPAPIRGSSDKRRGKNGSLQSFPWVANRGHRDPSIAVESMIITNVTVNRTAIQQRSRSLDVVKLHNAEVCRQLQSELDIKLRLPESVNENLTDSLWTQ